MDQATHGESYEGGFDFETALVTDIIDNKSIRTVIKHKLNADYMFGTQAKAAFLFLLQWFNNPSYGDVPSWESFQHSFPEFVPLRVEESTIALCDKLREQKLYSDMASVIGDVSERAMGDPLGAFELMRNKVAALHTAHTVDESCDIRSRVEELREEYMAMKSGKTGLKGHAWPWPALNDATLGFQDTQLVFIYGRPKSGKTWLLLKCILEFYLQGMRPVIFSQEMSDIEICRRFVALACGVNYNQYLRGQLPPDVERDFLDNLDAFVEREPVIIDLLTGQGADAILEANTKIDEYKASICAVDAFYTLGQDWKELVACMSGAKRSAKTKRVGWLATTQANRMGKGKGKQAEEGADDFAYADAFYQWCDAALRVSSDIEQRRNREAILSTAALREGIPVTFLVNMLMATDLSQKKVLKHGGDEDLDEQQELDKMDGQSDIPVDDVDLQPPPVRLTTFATKSPNKVSVPIKLVSIPKPAIKVVSLAAAKPMIKRLVNGGAHA